MTGVSIFVDNRELPLGRRIGKGGEGEVYVTSESGVAVKLYTVTDKATRERKILAMIRAGLAKKSPLTAFPISLARQRSGEFAGFTMRLVPDHLPLHDLYAPGSRKHKFPHADFRFLVRTAANISRAIASVHHAGCVIGDINHSSILISKKATVALIDADSFQISEGPIAFRCLVGVPEYTPPELQGQRLSEVTRTANHDAFGLAVVIFQMLFMGRHPFVGSVRKGEIPPIQDAIMDYRFVYSEHRDVGMDQPPGTPALSDFSAPIASAFEAAFARPNGGIRPTALDWVKALDALEKLLDECPKNKLHWYARDAAECPWCALEQQIGTVLFIPYLPPAILITQPFDPGLGGFDIDVTWSRIAGVAEATTLPQAVPQLGKDQTRKPSPDLIRRRRRNSIGKWMRLPVAALTVTLIFVVPGLWWLWILSGIVVAAASSPGKGSKEFDPQAYSKRYLDLAKRWAKEVDNWKIRCGIADLVNQRCSLENANSEYRQLPKEETRLLDAYRGARRERQLQDFLDSFLISNARIKGIGPAKLAALSSFGIESAAHISAAALERVGGFGPVNTGTLLAWRAKVQGRFVYREQTTDADRQELARVNALINAKGAELRKLLIPGAENLSRLVSRARSALSITDPLLVQLHQELEQAKCDLIYLTGSLPGNSRQIPGNLGTPSSTAATAPALSIQTTVVRCPRCSSPMVRRLAQRGVHAGRSFWGCSRFPQCKGTRS